ncbi:OmpA family protein [Balneicella halophila]|uniref:OmpA family protein n=1 Tax=Balneicella halophila TaxID=1537566 RepID=A0A7L4UQI8_BALHA|nr:OmpA family protein [Balneicella halophila]PVX52036.1 OmpA family protein [Balneicella halophila]
MKAIRLIILILLSISIAGNAEAHLLKKIKKSVKKGIEEGVSRTAEDKVYKKSSKTTANVLDTVLNPDGSNPQNLPDPVYPDSIPPENIPPQGLEETATTSLEEEDTDTDFKRGNIILYKDDFSKDAVGDFPAKWNSQQGGVLKKLKGYDEKWLKIPANSVVSLDLSKPLPPNFTIEFDLIIPSSISYRMATFAFNEKPKRLDYVLADKSAYAFMINSRSRSKKHESSLEFGMRGENNYRRFGKTYTSPLDKPIHVGIAVNNHQRIRLYLDGVKIVDAPRGFKPYMAKSFFFNATTSGAEESKMNTFYVSNFIVAESGIDKRSLVEKELLEKGAFTTNDILFSSGSDKIEPSSASILNEIGVAMKSAPDARFLIIGHTDSDGSDSANQKLSQDRATAVKNYLVEKFGIDANNLMCVGKGESDPIATNETAEGKAQNRRVEFTKL